MSVCQYVSTSVHTSVRLPYVRPQKVCPISMKFGMYIEIDDRCMMVCRMTRFKVKVKVTASVKFPKLHFSILYLLRHLQWELANNHVL